MSLPHLDRIITSANLSLVGALPDTIKYELFGVADEFLQDSGVWRDTLQFTAKGSALEYRIAPAAGKIARLDRVETETSYRVPATMPIPGIATLHIQPSPGERFTAYVILTVNDPITRDAYPLIPQWVAEKYRGVFVDGLLGRMMGQPSRPYSNETLAVYHLRRFRNGIAGARADARREHLDGAQAWRFPQTFAVKRR